MSVPALKEILELPAFRGAELITGAGQLDRVVAWVHVAEVLDVARFLSGGELILSTGLELARATPAVRRQYVHSIDQAGAHGLALELVQWMQEVPPEMIDAARKLDFPLLVFRSEVRFADLTRAAHERILRPHAGRQDEPLLDSLLAALVETGRSRRFLELQLGPLLALPDRPRTTLLRTLEALLDTEFNVARAARQLGVRRQTIYYRLDQLQGLLGTLDHPERHVGLFVALALLRSQP